MFHKVGPTLLGPPLFRLWHAVHFFDNLGIFSNVGYKIDDDTAFSFHLRGDSHKYSQENLTYRLNINKMIIDHCFGNAAPILL